MTRVDPKTSLRAVVLAPENPLPQSGTERRTSLMQTVLASVRDLDEAALRRVASLEAGTAFQPKALLALLTYCYAREIYASSEIEGLMGRDVNFRHLCGQEFPGPRHLRRFRRAAFRTANWLKERVMSGCWSLRSFLRMANAST